MTGVRITYKEHIGWWVAVLNSIVETRDSKGNRGNPIVIHNHTHPWVPHAHTLLYASRWVIFFKKLDDSIKN